MRLLAGWATDVGQVRPGNEDSLLIDEDLGVFAVADGMGGHRGGEVASSTAIEAVRVSLARGQSIDAAIRDANNAIRERALGDPEVQGMGTTFTAVVPLDDANVLIGHVGDSRAYMVREGRLRQLTIDHSLVADLVREGRITAEQAEIHPQRSIITRALGIEPDIDVDVYTVAVHDNDRIIICSDGLTDMVSERDLESIASATTDPETVSRTLVDAANDAGGNDNITVVVLDVTDVGEVASFIDHASDVGLDGTVQSIDEPTDAAPTASPTRVRIVWWKWLVRTLVAVVPIIVIVGIAYVVVDRRANNTWYVTDLGGEVVVMRGVPGGLWWYEPDVDTRTGLKVGTLDEGTRARVQRGFCERSSLAAALECVDDLIDDRRPVEP